MGPNVQRSVAHAIVKSPFFVVVLSNNFQYGPTAVSELEAALAFPVGCKKVIPVFHQLSVDDCLQAENELYHQLAAITGLHRRSTANTQFAKDISLNVLQMAVEQHESSKLPVVFVRGNIYLTWIVPCLCRQT